MVLDFVINKIESPLLDGISKNVTYKLDTTDLPSSPTGDMLTADLEIVTPLSLWDEGGRKVSITWRYNSGVNANGGQNVVKRYPLKSCVFGLLI